MKPLKLNTYQDKKIKSRIFIRIGIKQNYEA